jgi:flagellar motor switch protein FliM
MKRVLTQEEIDAVFQGTTGENAEKESAPDDAAIDFNRLDRIPRSQLQALHMVHENFVRNLASSLSAYLRSYVALNLISLEQISYSDFLDGLSSPTCISYIGLQPFDGTAILEINNSLVFALIELLLGGKGQTSSSVKRKITDIEKRLVQTLLRVVLRDLSDAWKAVTEIDFSVQSLSSEPQLMHIMAPSEAVIVIAIEVKVGETPGLMNFAIPALLIKRLRHKFDQLQQIRRAESTENDQIHIARLIQEANLQIDVQITGGTMPARTLLEMELEDVIMLEYPVTNHITGYINGREKLMGSLAAKGEKLAFELAYLKTVDSGLADSAEFKI